MTPGDVLLIASGGKDPRINPTLYGALAIWRRTDEIWTFAKDAVAYGSDAAAGPRAARDATTTPEILALMQAPPDTATDAASATDFRGGATPPQLFAFVFALAVAVSLMRPRRGQRMSTAEAGDIPAR